MAYSKLVLNHYKNPRNVGSLDNEDLNVGTGIVGNPSCGDVIKLQIKIDKEGIIQDVKFKAFGCASAIAATSLLTEKILKRNIKQVESEISNKSIAQELILPPVKLHCSVLAEDVLKAAKKDLENKFKNNNKLYDKM